MLLEIFLQTLEITCLVSLSHGLVQLLISDRIPLYLLRFLLSWLLLFVGRVLFTLIR